ncbi:MAG TPA: class I SAM-dependent methyltransferase [Gaiellaceae bacterium]|nr:class I SAM-dependent methyltransferase [Gaiellaceae bacterium]
MSFEEQAAAWIAWARWPLDAYWFYRDAFFELLPPHCRTLDVGCGEGRVTRDLRARGYDVVGLDASPTLLEAARTDDSVSEYVLGRAEALPFPDASFELVVAYNSLMDVDEMPAAVAEIGRVLVDGGTLVACITHPMIDSGRWVDDETFVIDQPYLGQKRYEGEFRRPDLPPFTFRGWVYPLESYSRALETSGMALEALREPAAPDAEVDTRPRAGHRWQRLPNFLMFRAARRAK